MTQNETQNPATPAEAPESAAQNTSGTRGPEAAADTAAALAAAQAEIAELKDRILRTAAEGENLHKRLEREKEDAARSEEHTSELQSLMRISYAVCCLKKKTH